MCTASFSNAPVYEMQFMITDITLDVCRKCAYRENYGAKFAKKAKKQKLLEKLNHNFNGNLPKPEK